MAQIGMLENLRVSLAYWPLSIFYFAFFSIVGALLPYWALYLQAIGFSPLEIGELMALWMATKIFGPNFWGWIADKSGRPLLILRVGAVATLAIYTLVYLVDGFWQMAAVMVGYSFFWNAVLPQLEALALDQIKGDMNLYSVVRLWGSVGFIVAVLLGGLYVDYYGATALPQLVIVTMVVLLVSSLVLKAPSPSHVSGDKKGDDKNDEKDDEKDDIKKLREGESGGGSGGSVFNHFNREVVAILLITFLMQASHGPYYTFYSLYLEQYDFSTASIGWLWTLGVVAEIIFFLMIPKWKGGLLAYHLLVASLLLASFRWIMIGLFPESSAVLITMQLLHAASYGAFHLAIIAYIHRLFSEHRNQGQAFYSSIGYGLGGALGAFVSGYVWKAYAPETTFIFGALFSLVAVVVAYRYLRLGRCATLRI